MTARYLVGDVRERLAEMPDASVDLVLSSPPFLALRSYLPADHPDKVHEIGSESTPGEFLDVLLDVVVECRRVLAPHGSLVFELGDTYAGSGGAGGDYSGDGLRGDAPGFGGSAKAGRLAEYDDDRGNPDGMRDTTFSGANTRSGGGRGWPLDKSKVLIPELFAVALSYGMNPLTGRTIDPWRVRNVIAWCRPNPPVGALGDKFRPATSYLTVACMARDRWFDLDAVRGAPEDVKDQKSRTTNGPREGADPAVVLGANYPQRVPSHPNGAPPLDYWEIPTAPYKGSHYATYPPELCRRPILTMCPEKVCRTCGEPSRRIVGEAEYHQSPNAHGSGRAPSDVAARTWESGIAKGKNQSADLRDGGVVRVAPTLGWTDCGHDDYRRGIVLDPFAGTGTTLMVAEGLGRDSVGIDLDVRNVDLARQRCGMFLDAAVPGMSTLRSDAKVSHFAAPRAEEAR